MGSTGVVHEGTQVGLVGAQTKREGLEDSRALAQKCLSTFGYYVEDEKCTDSTELKGFQAAKKARETN